MNFMYMKNVMSQFKRENEGSVIAEVGSEHCHSDGHITDNEEGEAREKGRGLLVGGGPNGIERGVY